MKSQIVAVLFGAALVVSPIAAALAQGGGSSGGGSGGASGSASGGATSGGATTGTGGGMQQATPQSNKAQAIQRQKDAATMGSETAPSQSGDGTVGGPGVGVGHSANGKPIGTPGSGLGSPENPVDVRK